MEIFLAYWYFWAIIVVGTVVWIEYDAAQHRIAIDSKPYGLNNGALAWALSGLLLWMATFPYCLVKRSSALAQARVPTSAGFPHLPTRSLAQELADLDALRQAGTITPADHERAKSKLLS